MTTEYRVRRRAKEQGDDECGCRAPARNQALPTQFSNSQQIPNTRSRLAVRCARGFARNLPPSRKRAHGNAGCPVHPQPRVRRVAKHAHEYSQRVHRISPAFPHAMALQLMSSSSRRSGSFATVAPPISDLSGPVEPDKPSARLDTSVEVSEPLDFVVRLHAPSSRMPPVTHGEQSALSPHRTPLRLPRPPHLIPRVRRSRYAPHLG
jgi:hypothetical protein